MRETLKATETLVKEGFKPMVYCVDDPIAAKQLEEAGAVAIMPLGAPIGSGLGIQNRVTIRLIVEGAGVPVLVDAGVGTASDAAVAMELGCDGVLMNTAIAEAKDPVMMARAMKLAVESGRLAYLAGRMGQRRYADPSSPARWPHLATSDCGSRAAADTGCSITKERRRAAARMRKDFQMSERHERSARWRSGRQTGARSVRQDNQVRTRMPGRTEEALVDGRGQASRATIRNAEHARSQGDNHDALTGAR